MRPGTSIAEIIPSKIVLADGSALASDITVWAAGVAAPPAVRGWGLPQAAGGRIVVGPDLRVAGQERIFAIGDTALIEGQPLPQLAQPALQMGKHAATQVRRLEAGQQAVPFRYHGKGTMATIGYRAAVVQFPHRLRARGTPAWLAWLALHLITLLGGRNRITALVNLSWRYLTWRHGGTGIIGDYPPATTGSITTPPGPDANVQPVPARGQRHPTRAQPRRTGVAA